MSALPTYSISMRPLLPIVLLAACHDAAPTPTVAIAAVDASTPATSDATLLAPLHPNHGLLAIADDPRASRDARCSDAFEAFRTRIHPGDSAARIAQVLGVPSWIGSDQPVDILGGEVPVDMVASDQTIVFMCLPKPDARTNNLPWSPWVIYARLEGRDSKTFGAFIAAGGAKKLIEYALCHSPDGQRTECTHFP